MTNVHKHKLYTYFVKMNKDTGFFAMTSKTFVKIGYVNEEGDEQQMALTVVFFNLKSTYTNFTYIYTIFHDFFSYYLTILT